MNGILSNLIGQTRLSTFKPDWGCMMVILSRFELIWSMFAYNTSSLTLHDSVCNPMHCKFKPWQKRLVRPRAIHWTSMYTSMYSGWLQVKLVYYHATSNYKRVLQCIECIQKCTSKIWRAASPLFQSNAGTAIPVPWEVEPLRASKPNQHDQLMTEHCMASSLIHVHYPHSFYNKKTGCFRFCSNFGKYFWHIMFSFIFP